MKNKTVTLRIPQAVYNDLVVVADSCTRIHKANGGFTSHGELDVQGLLMMLVQDAAATNTRPGSWEGSNMQQVLDAHGYR
ncbi:hypothetical protein [Massilia sp. CT11-137]|uniref:hypothetical protein n=1 Tax=Massilia sp. CT11-137 TaxID=3393901 RepID=UPI0039A55F69